MISFALGFLFDEKKEKVLLIEKNRGPKFLIGKWNGIGGHMENDETAVETMIRETHEETGLVVLNWREYGVMDSYKPDADIPDARIWLFSATLPHGFKAKQMEDEVIKWWKVKKLPDTLMENCRWLIPAAIDKSVDYLNIRDINHH